MIPVRLIQIFSSFQCKYKFIYMGEDEPSSPKPTPLKSFLITLIHVVTLGRSVYFRELDRDGDGRVSYKDFDFMMKYDVGSHIWLDGIIEYSRVSYKNFEIRSRSSYMIGQNYSISIRISCLIRLQVKVLAGLNISSHSCMGDVVSQIHTGWKEKKGNLVFTLTVPNCQKGSS